MNFRVYAVSILWRSWLTFTAVIFIVLTGFTTLSLLQNAALLSGLTRQRVAVVAETVGSAFQPIVDLGLPLSMMRNGDEIVERLRGTDPRITAIHVFDPSGVVIYSTAAAPVPMQKAILNAQRLADGDGWSLETARTLASGWTIRRKGDTPVGGVLVTYPREDVAAAIEAINRRVVLLATGLWLGCSALAFAILRVLLVAPVQGVRRLARLSNTEDGAPAPADVAKHLGRGLMRGRIDELVARLGQANRQTASLTAELDALGPTLAPRHEPPRQPVSDVVVQQTPQASLARLLARQLLPWAAVLVLAPVLLLGTLTLRAVNRSVEPEIAARVDLIGSVVSDNVQRAVSAGVPLENLVGADRYLGNLLGHFPEVAYIAIASGRVVLAVGNRLGGYLDGSGAPTATPGYPIMLDGAEIGYVMVDMNPALVARHFRDVFLDLGVVVLVSVLVAFEVLVLMLSRALTGPLDRLHHLLALQAVGDFSRRITVTARDAVDVITAQISERAVRLNQTYARLATTLTGSAAARLDAIGARHGLSKDGPARLVFPYFTDIRLALFLFAAADELPLSFMPLYTRAAGNPWPWLGEDVLISLPLAGYLVAILLASPFARQFAVRYGHRRVLVAAALPTLLGQIGLAIATSAPEIIAFRTLTGFGYAIVTLATQDYVIDTTAPSARSHTLASFTFVLFGGVFCGTALGGVLADRLGFNAVFLISAALIGLSAILFQQLLPGRDPTAPASGSARLMPPLLRPMRNLRFAGLVLGIAIPANVVLQAFVSYLVAIVLDSTGASFADIGRILMSYFLVVAFASPVAARIAEGRAPPAVLALAGAILSAAALALATLSPGSWTMLVAVVVTGIGHAMIRGPQVSVALAIAETDFADLGPSPILAALRTLERGGSVLGLLGIAALAGSFGYGAAILTTAIWVLGGTLLFLSTEFAGALRRARRA